VVSRVHERPGLDEESLARLREIARKAGEAILEHYTPGVGSVAKTDGSPLTLADTAAERLIVSELCDWDDTVPIISEETDSAPYEERRRWHRFWLVDPLDGTKEFLSHNGEFTVNIALVEDGEPVLGVVYAPALDLMYAAGKGIGSWKTQGGGDAVRIYHLPPDSDRPLVVIESRSHGSSALEEYLQTIKVGERVRVGSSLKFCRVAEGGADIYPRLGPTMEWDVAAGDCIYRNSAPEGQYPSTLTYNKPDLRNGPFVLGAAASGQAVAALA
jgi:3'(2'), 5'-bisphosphate nucleotidase